MAATVVERAPREPLHPLHSILLAFPVALFVGALLADLAYSSSPQVQWTNFASWLIAGGLFAGAFALIWALVDALRFRAGWTSQPALYFLLLLVTWILALINALIHARDAWGAMPAGLYLSAVVAVLALVTAWVGYSGNRARRVE